MEGREGREMERFWIPIGEGREMKEGNYKEKFII